MPTNLREIPRRFQAGMSLIEVLIAGAILAALVIVAIGASVFSEKVAATEQTTTDMEWKARELLRRFSSEIREARPPQPFLDKSSILFQRNMGVGGGQIVWGPDIVYAWDTEQGEVPGNAIDDNKNNLVDEGVVVRTEGGQSTVICRGVAPNGLLFDSDSTGITMDVVLISNDAGTVHTRSYRTKAVPRN